MRSSRVLFGAAREEFLQLSRARPHGDDKYVQGLLQLVETRSQLAVWFREQKNICSTLHNVKQLGEMAPGATQKLWDSWEDKSLPTAFNNDAQYWAVGQAVPEPLQSQIEFDAALRQGLAESGVEHGALMTAHYAAFYGPFLDSVTSLRDRLRIRWGLFGMEPEDRGFSSLCFPAARLRAGDMGDAFREDVGKLDLDDSTWAAMRDAAEQSRKFHLDVLNQTLLVGEDGATERTLPSWTIEELAKRSGKGEGDNMYIALCGNVYDVTESRDLYGPGKNYHSFTGRDTTCALAKMDLSEQALNNPGYTPQGDQEKASVTRWEERMRAKYSVVARLAL